MIDLKPCPCCGGTASLESSGIPIYTVQNYTVHTRYRVTCDECLIMTDYTFEPSSAIDIWNRRTIINDHKKL